MSAKDDDKKTCGPMYREALEAYTGLDPEKVRVFAAGFIHGQAEKIYLGACWAAMFRPSAANLDMVCQLANEAAQRYGLKVTLLGVNRPDGGDEVWIYSGESLGEWVHCEENSHAWHLGRGSVCGIPYSRLDLEFHKRAGYGEPCDSRKVAPNVNGD